MNVKMDLYSNGSKDRKNQSDCKPWKKTDGRYWEDLNYAIRHLNLVQLSNWQRC